MESIKKKRKSTSQIISNISDVEEAQRRCIYCIPQYSLSEIMLPQAYLFEEGSATPGD